MKPVFRLGPRAQAALVLMLVAVIGAMAGVIAERLAAQQRPTADFADAPFRVPPGMMGRGPLDSGAGMRPGERGPGGPGGGPLRRTVDTRYAERLSAMLDLTAEQQLAIDSILTEQRRHVRELTEQVQPRFRAIAEDTRRRVEAVLTAEQLEEMQSMRRRRMSR